MKKITLIITIVLVLFLSIGVKVYCYSETGHEGIKEVYFEGDGKLLVDITEEELEVVKEHLGKKAFGWSSAYFNYNRKVEYVGKTIFSKVNRSSEPFRFKYTINEEEILQRSVNTNGSVSSKISGVIEKIKTTITATVSGAVEVEDTSSSKVSKQTNIDVAINPGKKLSLVTKGEAYVTSGYSNFTIFGIVLRKGTWERIDIETVYYELIEEVA